MNPVREFYAALGVDLPDRPGPELPVRCFAAEHDHRNGDRNPSASVNADTGAFYCHTAAAGGGPYQAALALGCPPAEAVALLKEHGIKNSHPSSAATRNITYDYVGEDGSLLFQVCRGADKSFRQRRPDGSGGWLYKLGNTRRVLYRLPAVLAAAASDKRVFAVEGEKDVEALEAKGHTATCNPGGAGKWRKEYAESLRGAQVTIVADRDALGRKHAQDIARSLEGVATSVEVVESAVGKDVSDHLAAGKGIGDLVPAAGSDEQATKSVEPPETGYVLTEILELVSRYVVLPSPHESVAVALWVAHTWALDGAHATPYLLVVSPERRSGKTRLLEVLELVVRSPWRVTSTSEAAMFRKIDQARPTLLLDEVDAIFGSATERTEPLRAVLNSGNRPGASVARCVGDGANQQVVDFSVYCPKVLAGIDTGRVPDTIVDRSIRLAMKRKTGSEPTARLRHRDADSEAQPIRGALEAWGAAHADALLEREPEIPGALDDRAAEAWEPLLAIADLGGGDLPAQARAAAVALIGDDADEPAHGTRLLAKLAEVFADQEAMATKDILEQVNADEELPFGGWRHGEGLDGRGLSRLLKPYAVKRRTVRFGHTTAKGYRRDQLEEAWDRYLPSTPQGRSQGEHRSQPASRPEPDVTPVTDVTSFHENGGRANPVPGEEWIDPDVPDHRLLVVEVVGETANLHAESGDGASGGEITLRLEDFAQLRRATA